MIRHIVFLKMKEDAAQGDTERLVEALESLKGEIALVRELEVGLDLCAGATSYDIALNTAFDTFEDVAAYGVHPYHLKVVELIEEVTSARVKVDYEY